MAVGRTDLSSNPATRGRIVAVRRRTTADRTTVRSGRAGSAIGKHGGTMEITVLLVTMFFCFIIGVPIAYGLGLAAIAAALWIGRSLGAGVSQLSDGGRKGPT